MKAVLEDLAAKVEDLEAAVREKESTKKALRDAFSQVAGTHHTPIAKEDDSTTGQRCCAASSLTRISTVIAPLPYATLQMQANWLTADTLRPLLELSMKECPAAGSYSGGAASSSSASRPPTGPTASAVVNLGVVGRGNKRINLQPVTAASGAPTGADAAGRCMPAQYSCCLIACRSGRSCLNQHQHLMIAWQQGYGLSRSPEAA